MPPYRSVDNSTRNRKHARCPECGAARSDVRFDESRHVIVRIEAYRAIVPRLKVSSRASSSFARAAPQSRMPGGGTANVPFHEDQ
jgi:hypothetical protein